MIPAQRQKFVSLVPPAVIVDNASLTVAELDTVGFDYCQIVFYLGATDIAMTALVVTESDTAGSGHANVTGLIFGTSNNLTGSASTFPAATDDNKFFIFDIDLRGRKRYLDVTATVGNGTSGQYTAAFAILSRTEDGGTDAAAQGAAQVLRV